MRSGGKTVLKYTPLTFSLELLGAVLILGLMALTGVMYPGVSGAVPNSYDMYGVATGWGDRQAALLTPLLAVYIYLIMTGAGIMARRFPGADNTGGVLPVVLLLLLVAKAAYLIYALIRTYHVMLARDMPAAAAWMMVLVLVLVAAYGVMTVRKQRKAIRSAENI